MKPSPLLPNMKPKPTSQKRREPNIKSTKFLNNMLAVFLLRVKPASQSAKPGCMKNTSMAANSIHTVSSDMLKSCIVMCMKICVVLLFCYPEYILLLRLIQLATFPVPHYTGRCRRARRSLSLRCLPLG